MTTYIDSTRESPNDTAALVCPKCHQSNPSDARVCARCDRHLLVFCRHCGRENRRSGARCTECRTQLHLRWPAKWRGAKARTWIRPVQIALVVASAILAGKGIVMIGNADLSKSQPEPPLPVYVLNPDGTFEPK